MIRATLHMKVRPGTEEEFVRAFRAIADEVRRDPGSVRQTLMRDPDDPTSFVVMTDWVSREAFRQFETSSAQDNLTAPLRALRESASMAVYELVLDLEGGGGGAHAGAGIGHDQSR
jgi:heme-degrading monooxygenase HmoA